MTKIHLWDAIALTRPTLMIPLWTMHLLGAVHATGRFFSMPEPRWLLFSAAHTCLMGAVYILNQITDIRTDAVNEKLFLLADGYVSVRFAVGEMILLGGIGFLGILLGDAEMIGLFVASGVLGTAYSVPPFRLKGRAGWDLIANALGYGVVAFGVGWKAVAPFSRETWTLSIPYAFSVAATFAFTTIPDIPGDDAAGDKTLGVLLGTRKTENVGMSCLLLGCLGAVLVRNYLVFTALIPSTMAYLWALRRGEVRILLRVTQGVILWLALVATVGVPLYALWLAFVVGGTRWYYRRRFGVRYP